MRLTGVEFGSNGSISTTQPKRLASLGSMSALNRVSVVCQRKPEADGGDAVALLERACVSGPGLAERSR